MLRRLLAALAAFAVIFAVLSIAPAYADTGTSSGGVVADNVATGTALWGLAAGVLTPWLVAAFQQHHWSEQTRSLVAAVIAVAVGIVVCLVDGTLTTGATAVATVAAGLVASQAAYRELWSRVGVTDAIEAVTSGVAPKTLRARKAPPTPQV